MWITGDKTPDSIWPTTRAHKMLAAIGISIPLNTLLQFNVYAVFLISTFYGPYGIDGRQRARHPGAPGMLEK